MDTAFNYKTTTVAFRQQWIEYIYQLQDDICIALETIDGKSRFMEDEWTRSEGRGGCGKTRVISNGRLFEKAGSILL